MKISCPSCEAKYSIGDEKVQNRLAKIRCRKCGADIVIDGRVEPPSITLGGAESAGVPTAAGVTAGPQPEFTVDFAENDQRTLSLSDIVVAYNSGQVTANTFVWAEGMGDWTALGQVPSIVAALNEAASHAPAASAPRATATTASRQAQATAASTARATTKGAGRDLFGKVARAGSEEDVAAAQGGYDPHPAPLTTGARNESSVLFSLSALTATTKSKTSVVPTASASVTSAMDDSGLIDLKALASQASSAESASSPLGAAPLGMAPLGGLGAPLGGAPFGGGPSPLTAADLAPPPKSKTGLFIGGGIALAALIVVIAMALRPEPPPPPAPEPLPLPKPTHTAEPTAQPSAKPPPTGTEEAAKKPKYTGTRKKKTASDGSGTTGSGSEGSSTSGASTPKPASGAHCGCSPTDLPCNMKCSAKGG